ncbi:hypothetical protein [Streptomyces sp. NPDC048142]|uniref:hypothetical protein n=1 Tax=Streptomyces sp. NPDC048142 TaxID=3365501 RepID=UPI0037143241
MTNRKKNLRKGATLAAASVAAVLVPLVGTATAQAGVNASGTPGFLAASDMPDGSGTEWRADPVTKGTPEGGPVCAEAVFPAGGEAWHRQYWTDLDTGAGQVSVTMRSEAEARELVAEAQEATANCAADFLRDTPGGGAAWDDYGKVAVEDGAHVYGVHTRASWGAIDAHLIGIGRDGRTVTFVEWGQLGYLKDLPVEAFKKTMVKAVDGLR